MTTIMEPAKSKPDPLPPDHKAIAILAYQFWQERGCPNGSPEVDWYRAEQILSVKSRE